MSYFPPIRAISLCIVTLIGSFSQSLTAEWHLTSSTLFGGKGEDLISAATSGPENDVYIAGISHSPNWPQNIGVSGQGALFVSRLSTEAQDGYFHRIDAGYSEPGSIGFGRIPCIAADKQGNLWIAATIGEGADSWASADAYQTSYGGGDSDVGLVKLDSKGAIRHFQSYFGGDGTDMIETLLIDEETGEVFIAGHTNSAQAFPLTEDAWQSIGLPEIDSGFLAKLSPSGDLLFSTYLGGTLLDHIQALAFDDHGGLLVAGTTFSNDFPYPESVEDLPPRQASDLFVAYVDRQTMTHQWTRFLGGNSRDACTGLVAMPNGDIVLMGNTTSTDFPPSRSLSPDAAQQSGFLCRIEIASTKMVWSALLGGRLADDLVVLKHDGQDRLWVAGNTESSRIPMMNALRSRSLPFQSEVFVSQFSGGGDLQFSTYLGNSQNDFVHDLVHHADGDVTLVGSTSAPTLPTRFPITGNALQPDYGGGGSDGFITRIRDRNSPPENDDWTQAIDLKGRAITTWANNTRATPDAITIIRPGSVPTIPPGDRSLWWSWTAPGNGTLRLTTSSFWRGQVDSSFGSSFNTTLAIYAITGSNELTEEITNNDDPSGGKTSRLSFGVEAGKRYLIAVDGAGPSVAGEITLSLDLTTLPNDNFINAQSIESLPFLTTVSNHGATFELGESPTKGRALGAHSIWWRWRAPSDGTIEFRATSNATTPFWQIYRDTGSIATLRTAADYIFGRNSEDRYSTFQAIANQDYLIAVDSPIGETGDITIELDERESVPHDAFEGRGSIKEGHEGVQFSTLNASRELGWSGLTDLGLSDAAGLTTWWEFRPLRNETYIVKATSDELTAYATVFRGTALAELEPVGFHITDQSLRDATSGQVVFEAEVGESYQIAIDGYYWNAVGSGTLLVLPYAPPRLVPESVSIEQNTQSVTFIVTGIPNVVYEIQASNDLELWATLGIQSSENGLIHVTTALDNPTLQFFRAVEQQ